MVFLAATTTAALLTWAAFPPLDLGFLVFVAPAPFLWALRHVQLSRQAAGLGFLYGSIFFGVLLHWIFVLGAVAWLPLTIWLAATTSAYALVVWWARNLSPWRWWLVAVGGWALWEFLRARYPFGGFPWGSVGYPIGTMPWPRGAAQWIGATGWSVVVVAVAAGLALTVDSYRNQGFLAYPLAAVVLLTGAGALWSPSVDGPLLRVAIVQGNTPCPRVHCLDEKRLIYEAHLSLTRGLEPGAVDLVVWGENSTGGGYGLGNPEVEVDLAGEARRLGAFLLISGTRGASEDEFINANMLISPDGRLVGEYLKRHPVPFGEFVPFRPFLSFIPQLDQVPRDMVRGDRTVVFELPDGVIGTVISFEGAFARKTRAVTRAGAELITVNTNEASFGRSPASDQLIGMTRMAAAENGVQVIHAAISGKSGFIAADGDVLETTGLFTAEVVTGEVRWRKATNTFYTRVGDWLQVTAMAAMFVPLLHRVRRRDYLFTPADGGDI